MTYTGNLTVPLVEAVTDILSTHAAVIALLGVRSGIPYVVPFEDINGSDDPTQDFTLPLYVVDYVRDVEIGPNIGEREVTLTLDAIAEAASGGLATATDMLAIARDVLTWAAFNARGLDCFVKRPIEQGAAPSDPQATRGLVLHRLTLTLRATAP